MYASGDDRRLNAPRGYSCGAGYYSGFRRLIMRGGATSFICLAYFAVGGCAETQTAGIEIRAIPDASAKLRPGAALLADARAQLALNNGGLAIAGFREALREQPDS